MRLLDTLPKIKATPMHAEIKQCVPQEAELWPYLESHSGNKASTEGDNLEQTVQRSVSRHKWRWPKKPICFIGDPHADAEAFIASLVASGCVIRTGAGTCEFRLTKQGRDTVFVIGGDCLDKGPSNLELLRALRHLMKQSRRVKLLAGNHDVRLLMGIRTLALKPHPTTEHLFVRMGDKVLPLLKEIQQHYLNGKASLKGIPDEDECRRRLFPSDNWFEAFPVAAAHYMGEAAIERELKRMRKKVDSFEEACTHEGLSLREVYAIAQTCRALFLKKKGEFAWFYREMQLAYRKGSFLFVHAGLDDRISETLEHKSVKHLNRAFKKQVRHDLFRFYFGPLANTMRTKYRAADLPLTEQGVERVNRAGIHAVVHGHINRTQGQRLAIKKGLLHIESDVTLDRNSRHKEGLTGYGVGLTLIKPERYVIGISNDYPKAKVFRPESCL
ncbi:metallophosphoesterase [Marinobacterium lacunae]|nr:metallophosphoesterase [Marinobacterium lacunae]